MEDPLTEEMYVFFREHGMTWGDTHDAVDFVYSLLDREKERCGTCPLNKE